jgi:hypothetical protein
VSAIVAAVQENQERHAHVLGLDVAAVGLEVLEERAVDGVLVLVLGELLLERLVLGARLPTGLKLLGRGRRSSAEVRPVRKSGVVCWSGQWNPIETKKSLALQREGGSEGR